MKSSKWKSDYWREWISCCSVWYPRFFLRKCGRDSMSPKLSILLVKSAQCVVYLYKWGECCVVPGVSTPIVFSWDKLRRQSRARLTSLARGVVSGTNIMAGTEWNALGMSLIPRQTLKRAPPFQSHIRVAEEMCLLSPICCSFSNRPCTINCLGQPL